MKQHPLGIKPSGNFLLLDEEQQLKTTSILERDLGALFVLPPDILLDIISLLTTASDLLNIGHCSRTLYGFTYYDDLWKSLYLSKNADSHSIDWKGSWRKTVLRCKNEALLQCDFLCCDLLYRPYQCSQIDYHEIFAKVIKEEKVARLNETKTTHKSIPRYTESDLSADLFESSLIDSPFVITNNEPQRWPRWTLETLLQRFPEAHFQQESVNWSLKAYSDYLAENSDESPLYLFDCDSEAITELSNEYRPPQVFRKDLFTVFQSNDGGLNCRPNYRWLILGSAKTGSTFHKDPNMTCAWNAVLSGLKLWVLMPPNRTPPGVETTEDESQVTSPVSLAEYVLSGFFNDILTLSKFPENNVYVGCSFPGEVNYVPRGWWHLVINIDDTVAITQNFVPRPIMSDVIDFFHVKPDQVSGFHSDRVRKFLENLVESLEGEEKKKIVYYLQQSPVKNSGKKRRVWHDAVDDDEDVKKIPLDTVFEVLLVKKEFVSREELQKLEASNKKNNNNAKQKKDWVGEGGHTGFSFNFDID